MAREFEWRRKRAGHLMSKLRFLSAQLIAYLKNGLWLENARHANAMAMRLAQGLKAVPGATLLHPVEANELFAGIARGNGEQPGRRRDLIFTAGRCMLAESGVTIRLVTCFATSSADVDEFIAAAASIKPRG